MTDAAGTGVGGGVATRVGVGVEGEVGGAVGTAVGTAVGVAVGAAVVACGLGELVTSSEGEATRGEVDSLAAGEAVVPHAATTTAAPIRRTTTARIHPVRGSDERG